VTFSTLRSGCLYRVRLILTFFTLCEGPCIRSLSNPHLENDFQFDGGAERKACDAAATVTPLPA